VITFKAECGNFNGRSVIHMPPSYRHALSYECAHSQSHYIHRAQHV